MGVIGWEMPTHMVLASRASGGLFWTPYPQDTHISVEEFLKCQSEAYNFIFFSSPYDSHDIV